MLKVQPCVTDLLNRIKACDYIGTYFCHDLPEWERDYLLKALGNHPVLFLEPKADISAPVANIRIQSDRRDDWVNLFKRFLQFETLKKASWYEGEISLYFTVASRTIDIFCHCGPVIIFFSSMAFSELYRLYHLWETPFYPHLSEPEALAEVRMFKVEKDILYIESIGHSQQKNLYYNDKTTSLAANTTGSMLLTEFSKSSLSRLQKDEFLKTYKSKRQYKTSNLKATYGDSPSFLYDGRKALNDKLTHDLGLAEGLVCYDRKEKTLSLNHNVRIKFISDNDWFVSRRWPTH